MIIKKTPAEIEKMARAGDILVRTMDLLAGKIRPGVTTGDLDAAAEKFIRSQGATPSFKGYRGFPASICASPNDMVVHGIPGDHELSRGDVLSIDVGVTYGGSVGDISDEAQRLLRTTREALFDAVAEAIPDNRLGDVSSAVQRRVESNGFA